MFKSFRSVALCAAVIYGLTVPLQASPAVDFVKVTPFVPWFEIVDPPVSSANPLRWTLTGVTLEGGATATGFFIWDAGASHGEQLKDFDIQVSGGDTVTFPAFHYTAATSNSYGALENRSGFLHTEDSDVSMTVLFFTSNSSLAGRDRQFRLLVSPFLTSAGGMVPIQAHFSDPFYAPTECYNCNPWRDVLSGAVVAAVPEPAQSMLLIAGLGLVGYAARRRKRA